MFKAVIVLCFMTGPPCHQFDDLKGPYATEKQCWARVEEMRKTIAEAVEPKAWSAFITKGMCPKVPVGPEVDA